MQLERKPAHLNKEIEELQTIVAEAVNCAARYDEVHGGCTDPQDGFTVVGGEADV